MKFGGTSVANGNNIKHVAQIVKNYKENGHEIVVVTSALQGVTDSLLEIANEASSMGKVSLVREFIANLTTKHHEAAHIAIENESIMENVITIIDTRIDELEKALIGICYLGDLSARSKDLISSYGERLCAPILSGALKSLGVNSESFTGGDIGIITNEEFGNAKLHKSTYHKVSEKLTPILKDSISVVTGFIAESESGKVTTFGRGGSDYTASIIGSAINADEIWLWKEVDGIMTADPKIVKEARSIPIISYVEAMELSFFGAKVLHPRAIEPAIQKGIPVRVKNTFEPEFEGTLIIKNEEKIKNIVKAVTVIEKVGLINVSGAGMIGTIGVAARVFKTLADAKVNIIMISQSSSEADISMVVAEDDIESAINSLNKEFKNGIVREVSHDKEVCVIAVVGAGMTYTPGVAGRVFSAMGRENINVIMIGSPKLNISFVINRKDAKKAVNALHKEFELEKNTDKPNPILSHSRIKPASTR